VNRLFIELYVDEDVDVLVSGLLRARGFAAITTRDAGNLQAADAAQLAYAVSRQYALLTHNRADFDENPMIRNTAKQHGLLSGARSLLRLFAPVSEITCTLVSRKAAKTQNNHAKNQLRCSVYLA
jgi:hypothetical protein